MKNIFIRYQFKLIFCLTLFLFLLFGISNVTFAAHTLEHTVSETTGKTGGSAGGSSGFFEWFGIDDGIKQIVFALSTTIGMAVVWIGGMLLDVSIKYGVLEMGKILSPKDALGIGVLEIWGVVRDILNILFIFGLIYVGISTILDSHKSETQRTLGHLIIAALFVNFSLYATQVVVDFTNILAIQVYNQIIGAGTLVAGQVGADSISGAFLNVAGVSSFFGGDTKILDDLSFGAAIFYSIFMMVFLIVAGIVFAIGAVLLITRFAVLVLYMIFSPFMFAGWIFPKLGHASEEYWSWSKLLKQALFAPAFLFMLYLSLVVLQKLKSLAQFNTEGGKFSDMVVSGASAVDSFSMVMFFALMIVFLFASIKVASSMGVMGAEGASSLMGSVKNRMMVTAGGATAGMAGRVGRASVGRLAYNASESDGLKDAAAKGGVGGWAARIALKSARYTGDASFDARKVAGLGKATGLGEGAKGGFKTILSDVKKKEEAFAKSLGEIEDDDDRVSYFVQNKESIERKIHHEKQLKDKIRANDADQAELDNLKAEKEGLDPNDKPGKVAAAKKIAAVEKRIRDDIEKRKGAVTKVIEAAEKDLKKQEEIIKQEKSRRQIGAHVDAKTNEATAERYKAAEKAIKDAQDRFDAGGPAGKSAAARIIKEQNKIIKDLKHEAKKNSGELGYAGVLEESSHMASWATGRLKAHDKAAGKSVRKQFSKGHAKDEAHKHEEKHDKKGDDHAPKADGAATAKPH